MRGLIYSMVGFITLLRLSVCDSNAKKIEKMIDKVNGMINDFREMNTNGEEGMRAIMKLAEDEENYKKYVQKIKWIKDKAPTEYCKELCDDVSGYIDNLRATAKNRSSHSSSYSFHMSVRTAVGSVIDYLCGLKLGLKSEMKSSSATSKGKNQHGKGCRRKVR